MTPAKLGDTVQVHYIGRLDDDTIFDSSRERQPLVYTIGTGQVIEGFNEAILGMTVGETRKTRIPPEKAYGPHSPEMVMEISRRHFPPEIVPEKQALERCGALTVVAERDHCFKQYPSAIKGS